jgi:putative holliday junction resolvase
LPEVYVKRLVGIDYGRKRLGVAMTDPLAISVQGHPTLVVSGFEDTVSQILAFLSGHDVSTIVFGLPLNMDGTRGEMADEVERLGRELAQRSGIPVSYWDERLSSQQAKQILNTGGTKRRDRGEIDQLAAAVMLESYLKANPV